MALISCPECGKEVSNQAQACPNCGYGIAKKTQKLKRNTNGMESKNFWQTNIKYFGIAIVIIVVFFIVISRSGKEDNPFANLNHRMSMDEVHSIYGTPTSVSENEERNYIVDTYRKQVFAGIYGEFEIWYDYKNKAVTHAIWEKALPVGSSFNDYKKVIEKITDHTEKICNKSVDDSKWEDIIGNTYRLELRESNNTIFPNTIQIWYDPAYRK